MISNKLPENFCIKKASLYSKDAFSLLQELNQELERITGCNGANSFSEDGLVAFLIAYVDEYPIGCGAIRRYDDQTAEIKRIYARKNHCGAAHRLLASLEHTASIEGFHSLCLETRKVNEHAVSFYLGCGYEITPNYGKYAGRDDAVCFGKSLISIAANSK